MEAVKETKKVNGKKVAKIIVDVVCWIFFIFALVFTVFAFTAQSSVAKFPTIGGKAMLTVESQSMEGDHGFYVGDLIIVKVLPDAETEVASKLEERNNAISALKATERNADGSIKTYGDVITFWKDLNADGVLELNSHRIEAIFPSIVNPGHLEFQTKGDNNALKDGYTIIDDSIIGVWTGKRVAGMGSFINFLQPPNVGFFVCIILPLAGFLAYEVVILVLTVKKAKGGSSKAITEAEKEMIKQQAIEEFLKKQESDKAAKKDSEK